MGPSLVALIILSMAIGSYGSVNKNKCENVKINVIHEWKFADFVWDNQTESVRNMYNPCKCFLYDGNKAENGIIFVTMPNEMAHCPATLATVTNKTGPGGPLLSPYPSWEWYNKKCTCSGIVSVHRVHIQCNHIFVLDNGKIVNKQICQPKLLIFDLKNDMLVKNIPIPLDIATNRKGSGLLIAPYVYIPTGKCSHFLNEMIIFIADPKGNGLVVYDSFTKRMCRVESKYMEPTDFDLVTIDNYSFTYSAGIFSLTIIGKYLYYAPASGKKMYKIKIKTLLECPNKEKANKETKLVIQTLLSQSGQITSVGQSVIYSDSRASSIVGTNVSEKSDKHPVLLAQDSKKLQAVSSLKTSTHENMLAGISDRFHLFALNKVNLNETNFIYFEMNLTEVQNKINECEFECECEGD